MGRRRLKVRPVIPPVSGRIQSVFIVSQGGHERCRSGFHSVPTVSCPLQPVSEIRSETRNECANSATKNYGSRYIPEVVH
jgi:hypothetical protein